MPTGFYAWTKTWMFRSRDAYLSTWKLPSDPIALNDLPAYAFDSAEERSRVASLLERYNHDGSMTGQMDVEFAQLARERTQRHPPRSYLWIPIERAAVMWFTPRIAALPYSGTIWLLSDGWHQSSTGFEITLGFGILDFLYLGPALIGAVRFRESPVVIRQSQGLSNTDPTMPRVLFALVFCVLALPMSWTLGSRVPLGSKLRQLISSCALLPASMEGTTSR